MIEKFIAPIGVIFGITLIIIQGGMVVLKYLLHNIAIEKVVPISLKVLRGNYDTRE